MSDFTTVARVGEIPEGTSKTLTVGRRVVTLFHVAGQYYALNDYCPHMADSLGMGEVDGATVVCNRHGWVFQLADGACLDVPELTAETFELRVAGEEIQLRVV